MVVNGQLDVVLVGQLVEHLERFGRRLGDDLFEPELLGEVEDLARRGFVVIQTDDAVAHGGDVGIFQLLDEGIEVAGRDVVIGLDFLARLKFLPGEQLDVADAELVEQVDGFKKRELAEGPRLAPQPPAELVQRRLIDLRLGHLGGESKRRHQQRDQDDQERKFHRSLTDLITVPAGEMLHRTPGSSVGAKLVFAHVAGGAHKANRAKTSFAPTPHVRRHSLSGLGFRDARYRPSS